MRARHPSRQHSDPTGVAQAWPSRRRGRVKSWDGGERRPEEFSPGFNLELVAHIEATAEPAPADVAVTYGLLNPPTLTGAVPAS